MTSFERNKTIAHKMEKSLSQINFRNKASKWRIAGIAAILIQLFGLIAMIAGNVPTALYLIIPAIFILAFAVSKIETVSQDKLEKSLDLKTTTPELQQASLSIAVNDLARDLEIEEESLTDLRSALIVAQDLAFRQIQMEENRPVIRNASLLGNDFDAAYFSGQMLVCCDTAFLVNPRFPHDRVSASIKKMQRLKTALNGQSTKLGLRLMLLFITQMGQEELDRLRRDIKTTYFAQSPVEVDIRFLDFEKLQRMFIHDDRIA
ncbi:MAG TPA: hypothetical protein VNK26_01700 [Pyrinomonadaceae bacterium]|nr:hypothetical protein [Pyrinomonadaceae bacterium]